LEIVVNGSKRLVASGVTLLTLLRELPVDPGLVAVERNGELVERTDFANVALQAGDRLEVVRFVGGG
jgi:sulfur carrier protein